MWLYKYLSYPFELKINSADAQGILANSVPMDQSQRLSPVQLPQFYSPEESGVEKSYIQMSETKFSILRGKKHNKQKQSTHKSELKWCNLISNNWSL